MIKNASELSSRITYFTLQYKVNKYKVQLAVYTPVGNKKTFLLTEMKCSQYEPDRKQTNLRAGY